MLGWLSRYRDNVMWLAWRNMDGVMQFALAKLAHVYSGRGNIVSAFVWWMFFFLLEYH